MAGIYIHIPFCKQRCSYCDFHFSTVLKNKAVLVDAIVRELTLRKEEITEPIDTIYFGGGTPSLLTEKELGSIFDAIHKNYRVKKGIECTLEANPDDLSIEKIKEIQALGINRLSIGTQSFFEDELVLMNRSHNANQAISCIKNAQDLGISNISTDLIYGGQLSDMIKWQENLIIALALDVPHISSYALTVEKKTLLEQQIIQKKLNAVDEDLQHKQFLLLVETLTQNDFEHYELSNFAKTGFISQHNSNYWKGEKYLGIGPSAHSFDGHTRRWNVSNNTTYTKKIMVNELPITVENLTESNRFNELLMVGLRTTWGVDLVFIQETFAPKYYVYLSQAIKKHLANGNLKIISNKLVLSDHAKFFADGISSDLFYVDLSKIRE